MKSSEIIILGLILLAVLLLIIDIRQIKDKKAQCLINPLTYGVQLWEEVNNDELNCVCSFKKGGYMIITSENITVKNGG